MRTIIQFVTGDDLALVAKELRDLRRQRSVVLKVSFDSPLLDIAKKLLNGALVSSAMSFLFSVIVVLLKVIMFDSNLLITLLYIDILLNIIGFFLLAGYTACNLVSIILNFVLRFKNRDFEDQVLARVEASSANRLSRLHKGLLKLELSRLERRIEFALKSAAWFFAGQFSSIGVLKFGGIRLQELLNKASLVWLTKLANPDTLILYTVIAAVSVVIYFLGTAKWIRRDVEVLKLALDLQ